MSQPKNSASKSLSIWVVLILVVFGIANVFQTEGPNALGQNVSYTTLTDKITKDELSELEERSEVEKDIMGNLLAGVDVEVGDMWLIKAGLIHAIGAGCTIIEVQEPTDFTIQPERWCNDYHISYEEEYIGLTKDVALDAINYDIYGEKAKAYAKITPRVAVDTENYKKENEQLRKLLELKDTYPSKKTVAANVVTMDIGNAGHTLTIDKGTAHGIRKNSIALTYDGLVGVVCEAGRNYSKIRTITDAASSISGMCVRCGEIGIVQGKNTVNSRNKCSVNYLDKESKIVVGDIIETSGVGGICPKGILIGTVIKTNEDKRNLTASAQIKTSVDLSSITTVLVLK